MASQQMLNCKTSPVLVSQARCFHRNVSVHGASKGQLRGSEAVGRLNRRRTNKPLQISMAAAEPVSSTDSSGMKGTLSTYETLIIISPRLGDEERDKELAKFEVFLSKEMAKNVKASIRGRHRLAYPIKGHTDGVYVMYTYTAPRSVSQGVQKYLSKPEVGSEGNIIRHMTSKIP